MALLHRTMRSNEVRAPEVSRGEVVIVSRYSEKTPKVALVNPEDLAMLEEAHNALLALGQLEVLPVDDLTLKTRAVEDVPDETSIEDPRRIASLLGL